MPISARQIIKTYGPHWTPMDLPTPHPPRDQWTDDALSCLELNRDCRVCPVNKTHGIQQGGKENSCKMPMAVQTLLNHANRKQSRQ